MLLYPAIDLRGGRCVRLRQGDYGRETVYDRDPVEVAGEFAAAGARWIHVVDLDAARTGMPVNRHIIGTMVQAAFPALVQVGGGIRDRPAAEALLALGATRVVLGTAAVGDPELVTDLASTGRVAVGLDARGDDVAVQGWTQPGGVSVAELLDRYADAGVEAVVVTEIGRDGMLSGPDLDGLRKALAGTAMDVVASGGVGDLGDLTALARLAVGERALAGVIVGKALHDGRFTVEEAIAACEPSG